MPEQAVAYLDQQQVLLHPDTCNAWWGTEKESIGLAREVLSRFEAPVLADVGAAVGLWTLLATCVPGLRVMAFEPQRELASLLRENVQLNSLHDRVNIYVLALGAEPGVANLNVPGNELKRTLATLGREPGFKPARLDSVCVATLDQFVAIRNPTLVKVDAEGGELDVLKGARRTIERCQPAFMIEVQTKRTKQFGYDAGEIVAWMEHLGYQSVGLDARNRYFWKRAEHRP